ncbi:CidA/LrgA family protein [Bacillus piscicola]|uniref:CidA/LrgA family protein n=1 Tax=Bacillus piscicola TaxID=1632684 RepID=UPI001F093EB9|nr:CidA/LrgA family protein [Bacillus piscicola]
MIRIGAHILILYAFYYVGMWLQNLLNIVMPGSIIGMLLLLALLFMRVIRPQWIGTGAQLLIAHMPLLFLPVTVGVISYLHVFKGKGLWIIVVTLLSTVAVMTVSGWTVQIMARRRGQHE